MSTKDVSLVERERERESKNEKTILQWAPFLFFIKKRKNQRIYRTDHWADMGPIERLPYRRLIVLAKRVQVVPDGADEHDRVLRDDREGGSQPVQVQGGNVDTVNEDAALARFDDAKQRQAQGRLAAPLTKEREREKGKLNTLCFEMV